MQDVGFVIGRRNDCWEMGFRPGRRDEQPHDQGGWDTCGRSSPATVVGHRWWPPPHQPAGEASHCNHCLLVQGFPSRWALHLSFSLLSIVLSPLGSFPPTFTEVTWMKGNKNSLFWPHVRSTCAISCEDIFKCLQWSLCLHLKFPSALW